jgi:hypothetical protein
VQDYRGGVREVAHDADVLGLELGVRCGRRSRARRGPRRRRRLEDAVLIERDIDEDKLRHDERGDTRRVFNLSWTPRFVYVGRYNGRPVKRYLPAAICVIGILICGLLAGRKRPAAPRDTVEIVVHGPDGTVIPKVRRVGR